MGVKVLVPGVLRRLVDNRAEVELEAGTVSEAIRALEEGMSGVMVALAPPTVNYVPLEEATNRMKSVPLDSDTVLTARDLAISFGD